MLDYTFIKDDAAPVKIGDIVDSNAAGNRYFTRGDVFFAGAVISPRIYFNNANTFLFFDIAAGYGGSIVHEYEVTLKMGYFFHRITSLEKSMATPASHFKAILRVGGESMVSHTSPIAITYGVGCHYMTSKNSKAILSVFAGIRFGK